MNFEKGIHFNYDFERSILGVCMLEKDAFGRLYSLIEKECFYHFGHQLVFETMKEMNTTGLPIDINTVADQIFRIRKVPTIGDENVFYFVSGLTNYVVSGAHLEYYAAVLKTMWMEREIINLTHGGTKIDGNVRQKIYALTERISQIQGSVIQSDWEDMSVLMVKLYQHQEEMKKTGGIGKSIGIPMIDKENGGLHNGQMVVIGARPSIGKSAFAGGIALNMAKRGMSVGIISLEMSNVEVAARLAAIDTNTDFHILFRGLYRDEKEMHDVYNIISNQTSTYPIYVTDKTDVNVLDIKAKAQKLKHQNGIDCLMIDYLQLIDAQEGFNKTRENEIAKISRGCKIMAKEMNIPVVLLCQLNREVTKRKGEERYPQLSDLRESGAIEQDADVVMFLHRDWMAGWQNDENGQTTEHQADLVVRKWRNGKTNFIVPLDFDPPKMKFTERGQSKNIIPTNTSYYESARETTTEENPF